MLLSGWLNRLASQVLSPASTKRPRRKGIAQQRQTSNTAHQIESLESKTRLSNITLGYINEGQNIVISFPANTYINSVQFMTATTPSADMMDFSTYTITTTTTKGTGHLDGLDGQGTLTPGTLTRLAVTGTVAVKNTSQSAASY